jgi:predicted transcriptional regulator
MTIPKMPIPPGGALKELLLSIATGGGGDGMVVTSSRGAEVGVSSIDMANHVDDDAVVVVVVVVVNDGCWTDVLLDGCRGDTTENDDTVVVVTTKKATIAILKAPSRGAWNRRRLRAAIL